MMLSTLAKLSKSLIIATFFNLTFTNFGLTELPRQSLTADQPDHIADAVTNPNHTLAPLYRPISDWVGRLILPPAENNPQTDWVWIELTNVPPEYADLVGKKLRLQWSDHATLQEYLNLVTVDINFTALTEKQLDKGVIVPTRLNGRKQVGPLQSLAGARPVDDVMVKLNQVTVNTIGGETVLKIGAEPVQVTGSLYGLVQFIAPVDQPTADGSQYYRVRHYNQATADFDGPIQVIKFPAVKPDRNGILRFTPQDLEKSPAGQGGWYIYGAMNEQDEFLVRAISPRDLFELTPKQIIFGEEAGMKFLRQTGWRNLQRTRGEINRVLIDPDTTQTEEEALREWQEGERYLLIHLYGAVGSSTYSPSFLGIVSGHFSFGVATVVRDPFTNNLKFDIEYQQVFTHNENGIVAGAATWENYMGDIQRGWLGNIPVMDAIVKLGEYSDNYYLGSLPFTPLDELLKQLSIITARYRSGDGTGISIVTPSTSCVQDSNQALFLTLQTLERKVKSMPDALTWMKNNPDAPATEEFERLVNLAKDIDQTLTPLGIVRSDWQQNADVLAGVGTGNTSASFVRSPASLAEALLSKGTMSPRAAQENLIEISLRHDAEVWLLQTNQVGGRNDDLVPYAPTLVVN